MTTLPIQPSIISNSWRLFCRARLCLMAVLMAGAVMSSAAAANVTWSSASDTNFNDDANWTGGVISGNDAILPSNDALIHDPQITSNLSIASLSIDNSGDDYSLLGNSNLQLTMSGDISITGGGSTEINPVIFNNTSWELNSGSTDLLLRGGLTFTSTGSVLTLTNTNAVLVSGIVRSAGNNRYLQLEGAGSIDLAGVVQNGSPIAQTGIFLRDAFSGTASMTNAANTYSLETRVRAGTLAVGAGSDLGSSSALVVGTSTDALGSVANAVVVTTGVTTIDTAVTVQGLASTGAAASQPTTIGGTHTSGTSTYSGTLALNRDVTLTAASGGQVDFTNTISDASGTNAVVIDGGGAVRLAGDNTYGGTTTVISGTNLIVDGDMSGATGDVIVSSGTLSGTGTVGGDTTIADGATLAPGASPGILTFSGDLTLAGANTQTNLEIASGTRGTNYDGVDVGSLLTYGGDLTLTMTGLVADDTYNLFGFSSFTGDFDSLVFGGGSNPYSGLFTFDSGAWTATSGGQQFVFTQSTGGLVVSTIPEPTALGLIAMGLTALVGLRRRPKA